MCLVCRSSFPVVNYPSSLPMNSSCALCRSALCIHFLGRHSKALGGRFSQLLARVTAREVISTMFAEVDCKRVRLHAVAASYFSNLALEQSRHLISRTPPCGQLACIATGNAWYPVLRSFGISKYFSSSCCCCGTVLSMPYTTFSTLPSTQIRCPPVASTAHPCWRLGPNKD
jgi:hypothetical protein